MPIDAHSLRTFVYGRVLEDAVVPTLDELAEVFSTSPTAAARAVREAGLGKTLMPDAETGALWMVGPFSARPTRYRVEAAGKAWFANCAWDAFGVHALVGVESRVTTACEDCGSEIALVLRVNGALTDDSVVHFLVPAREWYRDIGFT